MTDVFVSMNDQDSEEKIEFKPFQVTTDLMSKLPKIVFLCTV